MVKADLTILVAQQLISAATLRDSARLITDYGAPVAFGGRIFTLQPDLVKRVAGHYLGNRLDSVMDQVEALLEGKPVAPQPVPASTEYVETLKAFLANRFLIENRIDVEAQASGINPVYFDTAHKFMGDNIIACLRLGAMTYLDGEIDWLVNLLKGFDLPESMVPDYLRLYSVAVYRQLDGHAQPITDWLEKQIS
jgi:hypothetical protein